MARMSRRASGERAVDSFLMSPSTAFGSCIDRRARRAPSRCGPSIASRQASTARSETRARMARCGTARSGSGWAFTGLVVGIGEPSGREVRGMMPGAAPTSPNRPSAITACARTRGEGSASAARNGAASTPSSSVLRSASARSANSRTASSPASLRRTPCDPAPSTCFSAKRAATRPCRGLDASDARSVRARVVSGDGPRRRISRWQWKREAALGPHKPSISSASASPFGSTA